MHNAGHWVTAPAIAVALGLHGVDIVTFTLTHALIDLDHVTALMHDGGRKRFKQFHWIWHPREYYRIALSDQLKPISAVHILHTYEALFVATILQILFPYLLLFYIAYVIHLAEDYLEEIIIARKNSHPALYWMKYYSILYYLKKRSAFNI